MTYANGNIYIGEFHEDLPHGDGELTYVCTAEGFALTVPDKYSGRFIKGHPVKSDNLRLAGLSFDTNYELCSACIFIYIFDFSFRLQLSELPKISCTIFIASHLSN